MCRYRVQHQAHSEVLSGFDRELRALEAVELHPAVQSEGRAKLIDLVDAARLRDWAGRCSAAHQGLAQKVWSGGFDF